ncbi:MAG: ADP-forming succinate--CoA ligase subunit beta [Planctomycetes bacterium]|nr:ADP-forming succinate--CoA ligase subunit beta [Planctomycetota bacterium]
MKIHEFQGKQLFKAHGVPVLRGIACTTVDQVEQAAIQLGSPVVVVKSQIHAGGRGKGTVFADEAGTRKVMDGGVKVVKGAAAAREAGAKLLGNWLKTIQTGDGTKQVKTIYVEDGCQIAKELYLSILLDRAAAAPVLVVSREGGMDIEEVAHHSPEKILKLHFDPHMGLGAYQARRLGFELGLTPIQVNNFVKTAQALAKCFIETDADMLEVNPLVVTINDEIVALDSKMSFDDNALFRHPDIAAFLDPNEEDAAELEAKKHDMAFVKLDGNIGCMVNGAGLAMATMDAIALYGSDQGAFPANFLDVGGGATAEKVTTAFKIILKDPSVEAILVNIFGGIMKCDTIASGVLTAVREVGLDRPLVVRLEGTNVAEGKKMIAESGLTVIAADDLKDGCVKAAKAANAYRIAKGIGPRPALPTPSAIAYIPRKVRKSAEKVRKSGSPEVRKSGGKPMAKTKIVAKKKAAPAGKKAKAVMKKTGKPTKPVKKAAPKASKKPVKSSKRR